MGLIEHELYPKHPQTHAKLPIELAWTHGDHLLGMEVPYFQTRAGPGVAGKINKNRARHISPLKLSHVQSSL